MARLSRKQQQDKHELLSSLNHMNNCIGTKHAAENRKFIRSFSSFFSRQTRLNGKCMNIVDVQRETKKRLLGN